MIVLVAHARGQRDIRWLPQGMVGGKGFDVVHVEAGAGDSAGP
jgi:hypothetical protein